MTSAPLLTDPEPAAGRPAGRELRATGVPALKDSRELLINLTLREVRGKYKRTALGHLWSLVNPLAIMLMYTLVFSVILKVKAAPGRPSGVHYYALFLLAGLLPWTFFSNAVTTGMSALLANANLLKKVYFRRDILVTSTVFSWLVTFGIEVGVLLVALLVAGGMPLPWLPLVLLTLALLTLFALGLALGLSVMNVYFRDTEHFVSIAFLLWFYLTPVLYPLSYVTDAAQRTHRQLFGHRIPISFLYQLNPMERFVTVLRTLLYDNTWPHWGDLAYCAGATGVALLVGYQVFRRFEGRLAEEL